MSDAVQQPPLVTPAVTSRTFALSDKSELSLRAIVVGSLLGLLFTLANLKLVIASGVSISASVPSAVLGATILSITHRILRTRRANMLEHNMIQTIGSVGESVAFAVVISIPLFAIYGVDFNVYAVATVTVAGALFGALAYLPMESQVAHLTFPEGKTCAEVIKAIDQSGDQVGRPLFAGAAIGAAYVALRELTFRLPKDFFSRGLQLSPELMGIGYIIGWKTAVTIGCGGLALSVLKLFSSDAHSVVAEAAGYRFFVAGMLAAGALWRLKGKRGETLPGTTRLPADRRLTLVTWAMFVIAVAGATRLQGSFDWVLTAVVGVCAYFACLSFARISAVTAGEIGSSANPISALTIAAIVGAAAVLALVPQGTGDAVDLRFRTIVLFTIATMVAISSSAAGMTAQVLKTGATLRASRDKQLVGLVIGAVSSGIFMAAVLPFLISQPVASIRQFMKSSPGAPLASLENAPLAHARAITDIVAALTSGTSSDYAIAIAGAVVAVLLLRIHVSPMAFAVGMYIGHGTAIPMAIGGLVAGFVDWRVKARTAVARQKTIQRSELFASGLVAAGILLAIPLELLRERGILRGTPDNAVVCLLFVLLAVIHAYMTVRPRPVVQNGS